MMELPSKHTLSSIMNLVIWDMVGSQKDHTLKGKYRGLLKDIFPRLYHEILPIKIEVMKPLQITPSTSKASFHIHLSRKSVLTIIM